MKALADLVASADALLIGPGLDDGEETAKLLGRLTSLLGEETKVVLDAYALGALAELGASDRLSGRLVLTPNPGEAEMLLEAESARRLRSRLKLPSRSPAATVLP